MVKRVMGSTKSPRIKRGSQSYHYERGKDYKPGQFSGYSGESSAKSEAARQAQIERETKAANERRAKEKRQRVRKGYRAGVVAARSDASRTAGEKALPRGGGRAKASAARAAATRKKNIAASNKAGTYARTAKNQTERNKARARSDARTRVGGGSPGSRVAGGLARVRGR